MKFLSALLILVLIVPLNAQWTLFDLEGSGTDDFKADFRPFLQSVSLSIANHFETPVNINKRLYLGCAYTRGINISGIDASTDLIGSYPNFGGSLLISENLILKGNFSIFSSGKNVVQSIAYGLGLNLTNKEKNNWRVSALFSQLQGPKDIKIKVMDTNVIYDFSLKNIPVLVGMGANSYKVKILFDEESVPNSIKGNANYLLLGVHYINDRFTLTPILLINSNVLIVRLEILGAIR